MLASYYYDDFGNITEQIGEVKNPYRYAGYQYDEETEVYYLNARYYDPKIARFLNEDTYRGEANDPLSLNLYTYCHNEPIMYTDPTGHRQETGMDGEGTTPPKPPTTPTKKDKEKEDHIKAIDKEIEKIKNEAGDKELTKKAKDIIERLEKLKELVMQHKPTDDISSISESDNSESENAYILKPESLVEYVVNSNLNETQMEALLKINDYSNNSDIQKNGGNTLIFFFEGAGSYKDLTEKTNPNHPDGRYGAMVVVVKDGEIKYITTNASTLPDDPNGYHKNAGATNLELYPETQGKVATVKPGVYSFSEVLHGSTKYPALQINGSDIVPATRIGLPDTVADGVHIHKGQSESDSLISPTSLSCLTIHPDDCDYFAKAVGFAEVGRTSTKKDPLYNVNGLVVIDRTFVK